MAYADFRKMAVGCYSWVGRMRCIWFACESLDSYPIHRVRIWTTWL